jgi:hypothetical protein
MMLSTNEKSSMEEKVQTEKAWYVVRAISGKEKKVKEYIDLEISRLNL